MSFQFQSSDVLARLKPFGISFEKSLNDLIKGIRSHSKESPESLGSFLDNAIVECKNELSTNDMETKAMAVLKLAYLEMYGFNMAWANFHILEVMSSNKFQFKRVGYLAAIQSFKSEQDLLILATNQFKKDLNSHNHIEIGLALSGIATIVTPNLSKDINDDVLMKLSHSKPYIRKKAILAMYKVFLQYPESLRINFNRVIDMLDDEDISVISATINVICEISKKNPKIFVNYLPKFFKILEETKNNWLTIRILKLFQSLSKVEPRMKRKILPYLLDLMVSTEASSLIYECINCIVNGSMLSSDSNKDKDVARLCIEQILKFFQADDPNLKYVGLLALINTVKVFPTLIKLKGVSSIIMDCITDNDLLVKQKTLEICQYLITEDKIVDLIKVLLVQLIPNDNVLIPDTLKLQIVLKILSIGSMNNYGNVPNFKWYIAVLKDMVHLTLLPDDKAHSLDSSVAKPISIEIAKEFKTLAVKIPSLRSRILNVLVPMILDVRVLENCPLLLKDFYWILGEYIDELKVSQPVESDDEEDSDEEESDQTKLLSMGKKIEILNSLTNFKVDKTLELTDKLNFEIPGKLLVHKETEVLVILIQCLVKVFNGLCQDYLYIYGEDGKLSHSKVIELGYNLSKLIGFLSNWENHNDYEVQERSLSWLEFLKLCFDAMVTDIQEIKVLETSELKYYRELKKSVEYEDSEIESESSDDDSSDESDYLELSSDEDAEEVQEEVHEEVAEEIKENEEPEKNEPESLPVLISHVLPTIFKSYELNPISKNGQRNVPMPDIDLETTINNPEFELFNDESEAEEEEEELPEPEITQIYHDEEKKVRLERIKYDPYYISEDKSEKPKKIKKLIDLDEPSVEKPNGKHKEKPKKKLKKEKVLILADEGDIPGTPDSLDSIATNGKKKKNILKIDSSNLDNFDLNESIDTENDYEYKIDLEDLRSKLVDTIIGKPKKKTKKKAKGSKEKISKEPVPDVGQEVEPETKDPEVKDPEAKELEVKDRKDSSIKEPKTEAKPIIKKKKKKSKAIIE